MARIDLPESRLRLRKRRRRVRLSIFFFVLFLLAVSGVAGLTYLPALQITTVAVSGAQTLSSSTVEAFVRGRLAGSYWRVFPNSNIFLYPKARISAGLLSAYPSLASADVHAADFHTVEVSLTERQPRALWCSGTCYFMDEDGVIYAEAPVFSEPVYTVYTGTTTRSTGSGQAGNTLPQQFLPAADFQALASLVGAIQQKLPDERLLAVSVTADKDVQLSFADAAPAGGQGFVLKFALDEQGGDVFERLGLALQAEPFVSHKLAEFEYLDLRFGDKLYYKLR